LAGLASAALAAGWAESVTGAGLNPDVGRTLGSAHHSSELLLPQSSGSGLPTSVGGAALALLWPRRMTRKGTETVGAGSAAPRLGPAQAVGGRSGSASTPQSSRSGSGRRGLNSSQASGSGRRRTERRGRICGPAPCSAKAAPAALRPAPRLDAPAIQRPRGRAGEVQVRTRTATAGLGFTAPTTRVASSGESSGSSRMRFNTGAMECLRAGSDRSSAAADRAHNRGNRTRGSPKSPPSPPGMSAGDTRPVRGARSVLPPPPRW